MLIKHKQTDQQTNVIATGSLSGSKWSGWAAVGCITHTCGGVALWRGS